MIMLGIEMITWAVLVFQKYFGRGWRWDWIHNFNTILQFFPIICRRFSRDFC